MVLLTGNAIQNADKPGKYNRVLDAPREYRCIDFILNDGNFASYGLDDRDDMDEYIQNMKMPEEVKCEDYFKIMCDVDRLDNIPWRIEAQVVSILNGQWGGGKKTIRDFPYDIYVKCAQLDLGGLGQKACEKFIIEGKHRKVTFQYCDLDNIAFLPNELAMIEFNNVKVKTYNGAPVDEGYFLVRVDPGVRNDYDHEYQKVMLFDMPLRQPWTKDGRFVSRFDEFNDDRYVWDCIMDFVDFLSRNGYKGDTYGSLQDKFDWFSLRGKEEYK